MCESGTGLVPEDKITECNITFSTLTCIQITYYFIDLFTDIDIFSINNLVCYRKDANTTSTFASHFNYLITHSSSLTLGVLVKL